MSRHAVIAWASLLVAGASAGGEPSALQDAKLVQSGRNPRRVVRFSPVVGSKKTWTISARSEGELILDGKASKAPSLDHSFTVTLTATVVGIGKDGDVALDLGFGSGEVKGAKVVPRGSQIPTARATMSHRGILKEFNVPNEQDPRMRELWDQVRESYRQMAVGFPEEPIGLGAVWSVEQNVKKGAFTFRLTTSYEVTTLEETAVGVHMVTRISGDDQKTKFTDSPEFVVRVSGTGTGNATWDLAWPCHASPAEQYVQVKAEGVAEEGGEQHKLAATLELRLKVSSDSDPVVEPAARKAGPAKGSATRTIDAWEGQEPGTWFRVKISPSSGEDSYVDTGLKGQDGPARLLVRQRCEQGKPGPVEEVRLEPAGFKLLGTRTLQFQGRDYPCELLEGASGEKIWAVKDGRHGGATLRMESPQGKLELTKAWEYTQKLKGRPFECLVLEGEYKSGDKSERVKTWYSAVLPERAFKVERESETRVLVDFGSDWSKRPPFPDAGK